MKYMFLFNVSWNNFTFHSPTLFDTIWLSIDKPKFLPNTTGTVWIDREKINSGITEFELNFTCIVEADPVAIINWYDSDRHLIRPAFNYANPNIINVIEDENISILKYKYNVIGRGDYIEQPDVEFECRTNNWIGTTNKIFKIMIGDASSPNPITGLNSGSLVLDHPSFYNIFIMHSVIDLLFYFQNKLILLMLDTKRLQWRRAKSWRE